MNGQTPWHFIFLAQLLFSRSREVLKGSKIYLLLVPILTIGCGEDSYALFSVILPLTWQTAGK
jgi:hypothetical protein